MSAYKKTKTGPEYCIYESPIVKPAVNVIPDYLCGGAVIYRPTGTDDLVEILGHAKYVPGWESQDYAKFLSRFKAIRALGEYCVEALPVVTDYFISKTPLVTAESGDLDIVVMPFVLPLSKLLLRILNISPLSLFLLCKSDEESGRDYLLGYCTREAYEKTKRKLDNIFILPMSVLIKNFASSGSPIFMDDEEEGEFLFKSFISGPEELPILSEIRSWLSKAPYVDFLKAVSSKVMGQEEVGFITANVYHYLDCIANGKPHNTNILLAAPSGCGKTESFRAIRQYFKSEIPSLPIIQFDMTSMTEEGFRGNDAENLVEDLLEVPTNGIGIVFMDEFDKKLIPSYATNGNNVNAAVQAQLLTLIEGREIRHPKKAALKIDSTNTMFVGLGSFDACRERKKERANHRSIGFGDSFSAEYDHYEKITTDDMIELGASYELLGRFVSVVNYHSLSRESVENIINHMLEGISESFGCKIMITSEMKEELIDAANSTYGCRRFLSLLNDCAVRQYAEILAQGESIEDCTIIIDTGEKTRHFSVTSEVA